MWRTNCFLKTFIEQLKLMQGLEIASLITWIKKFSLWEVTAELQHRLELMKNRGSPVRALFSPICNLMIDILKYQAKELKDILRDYNNTDAERRMNSIKERANLLVTYLGRNFQRFSFFTPMGWRRAADCIRKFWPHAVSDAFVG